MTKKIDLKTNTGLIKVGKTCSCGKFHEFIPASAKFFQDDENLGFSGYWWNCACRSTMFMPISKIEELELDLEAA